MEAGGSPGTSKGFYQTTCHNGLGDSNLHRHGREDFKSQTAAPVFVWNLHVFIRKVKT